MEEHWALRHAGTSLLAIALLAYVVLWVALATSRGRGARVKASNALTITFAATVGTSLLTWSAIPWWAIPLVYIGSVVAVAIPVVVFRAR